MKPRLATILFQEMPACAIDDAFTPTERVVGFVLLKDLLEERVGEGGSRSS